MSGPFEPRLEILPSPQRAIWGELQCLPAHFVLYGGTALALRLGHRQSVDFDFFGSRDIDPDELLYGLPILQGARTLQRERNSLTVTVDRDGPVKISFFGVPRLHRLRPADQCRENGLRIASLLDLAGTKASVVQVRAEAKDYIDLDAIFRNTDIDLVSALGAACALYGESFNPQITLKALSYFDDGDLAQVPAEIQRRLVEAARDADLDSLPHFDFTPDS